MRSAAFHSLSTSLSLRTTCAARIGSRRAKASSAWRSILPTFTAMWRSSIRGM
ncbi:Uncharacterised protein [Bordetella pertussis]|nr:Uncharacterised protein [Bordetella pertussis]CFP66647.1 Uncharacterised protein [Bordetella pertussis]CFW45882.1 Uncharacterised protein [Bordetella pertussis]